ncbi:hypothetical protein HCU64_16030 [Methylobacterium sp. C25]|uniref:DUF6894 family protein n=1 Tax=Methylobacterium sp. C25 TaxID=2721622 RepID=UPI001F46B3B6|nr:hypothetical protein [Methylobacterium sp. C25]MCE4225264.1 hypothetical protein [Methylobacterium sp. C25]
MPRYFFDIHDGMDAIDNEGLELPDLETAQGEAVLAASNYVVSPKTLSEKGGAVIVVVRDGPDNVVMTARLVFDVVVPEAFSKEIAQL